MSTSTDERVSGLPTNLEEVKPLCKEAGCEHSANAAFGWCRKHYTRWQRHGDPSTVTLPSQRRAPSYSREKVEPIACTVEGCDTASDALGLCSKHYQRQKKYGSTVDPPGPGSYRHGHGAGKTKTPEYNSWQAMTERCRNPKNVGYRNYGAKGIAVCERWRRFENFLADMGPRPSRKHTLDRFPDKGGNYEPGNVRWATWEEQSRNKAVTRNITIDSATRCLKDWATLSSISYETVCARLKRGWSVKDAIFREAYPHGVGRWDDSWTRANGEDSKALFADAATIYTSLMDVIDSRNVMDLWEGDMNGYGVTEEQATISRGRFADAVIKRIRELQSPPFNLGIKLENYCSRHAMARLPRATASTCADCAIELEKRRINDPD